MSLNTPQKVVFGDVISKKAFELAYGIYRVAEILPESSNFGSYLKGFSLDILYNALRGHAERMTRSIQGIRVFIHLAHSLGFLSQENVRVLENQLKAIENALSANNFPHEDRLIADFGRFFPSENTADVPEEGISSIVNAQIDSVVDENIENAATNSPESGNTGESGNLPHFPDFSSNQDRRDAVLTYIQDSGYASIRDLAEAFPGISARTMRYDLQDMVLHGILERIDQGGPGTSYRIAHTHIS
jgi:hypothetical protein